MDGNRFDDITRRLAKDSSRRSFLKRSVATVAALAGIGGAGADAARRPPPTPRSHPCPGELVWCGEECCCPDGTERCGAKCCPAAWQCCDGACCFGTCYGEELCCPTGQIVCEGRCLDAGLCCTDGDCPPGWVCGVETPNICACVPTVTCASSGRNCGPLTDECGNPLECGVCQAPNSCGGSGVEGVCGCTVTTTCDGKCGDITTNCGTTLNCGDCQDPDTCGGGGTPNVCGCQITTTCDGKCGGVITNCGTALDCGACPEPCGGACGPCQTCSEEDVCVQVSDGTQCGADCSIGFCIQGNCSILHTIECPDDAGTGIPNPNEPCNSYQCVREADGPRCVATPANDGRTCSPLDACQTGVCSQGTCVATPRDCGTCMECREGSCQPSSTGTCGPEHRCVEGVCSHFPTGTPPTGTDVNFICSELKCEDACCPGPGSSTCCDSMDDCFLSDGGGILNAFCCDPANKCGSDCCAGGYSCAGGTVCRPDGMICADNPNCGEACCGGNGNAGSGTCCPSGTRCANGSCTAVPTATCTSHAACGSGADCAGLVLDLQTGAVETPGTCCLSPYSYIDPFASQGAGQTIYGCCQTPLYVGEPALGANCCSFTDAGCPACTCSRTSVRRWGN